MVVTAFRTNSKKRRNRPRHPPYLRRYSCARSGVRGAGCGSGMGGQWQGADAAGKVRRCENARLARVPSLCPPPLAPPPVAPPIAPLLPPVAHRLEQIVDMHLVHREELLTGEHATRPRLHPRRRRRVGLLLRLLRRRVDVTADDHGDDQVEHEVVANHQQGKVVEVAPVAHRGARDHVVVVPILEGDDDEGGDHRGCERVEEIARGQRVAAVATRRLHHDHLRHLRHLRAGRRAARVEQLATEELHA